MVSEKLFYKNKRSYYWEGKDQGIRLTTYMERIQQECLSRGKLKYAQLIGNVNTQLAAFMAGKNDAVLGDVDELFLQDFVGYLMTAVKSTRYGRTKSGSHISGTTIQCYYSVFRSILNKAFRAGLIEHNPTERFRLSDMFETESQERTFLTIDELKRMISTPCRDNEIRQAFLFSCMCGLRISDIRRLTWGNISLGSDRSSLRIRMKKTREWLYLPLSPSALRWLPQREERTPATPVFRLKSTVTVCHVLGLWARASGITKHVTFHVARHTHATMMLTLGTDLYTVSSLLGHRQLRTTLVYAKIVDRKKEDAVALIPDFSDCD